MEKKVDQALKNDLNETGITGENENAGININEISNNNIDLSEKENEILISMPLSGLKRNSLNFSLKMDSITIESEKKKLTEIANPIFRKTIKFSQTINPEKAKVKIKNGIFSASLPKKDYLFHLYYEQF